MPAICVIVVVVKKSPDDCLIGAHICHQITTDARLVFGWGCGALSALSGLWLDGSYKIVKTQSFYSVRGNILNVRGGGGSVDERIL